MRNLRVTKRANDMPMYAQATRLKRGVYQVIIKAKASKRIIDIELIYLPSLPAVKALYARTYPTLTWGKPKYPKPKIKLPKRVKPAKKGKRNAKRSMARHADC